MGEHAGEFPRVADTFNPTHLHEPSSPVVLDAEGRCLVCTAAYGAEEMAREIGRLNVQNERLRAVVDEVIETNSKALYAYAIWRETGDSEAADTLEAWSSLLRRAALSGEET